VYQGVCLFLASLSLPFSRSCVVLLWVGADLHVALHSLCNVGWFDDCLWRSWSRLLRVCGLEVLPPRGGVMTMTLVLFRRDPLWRCMCVCVCVCVGGGGILVCRSEVVMVFARISTN
jgi:hypothetical protein